VKGFGSENRAKTREESVEKEVKTFQNERRWKIRGWATMPECMAGFWVSVFGVWTAEY
jgi:hypothetical protein